MGLAQALGEVKGMTENSVSYLKLSDPILEYSSPRVPAVPSNPSSIYSLPLHGDTALSQGTAPDTNFIAKLKYCLKKTYI